MAGTVRVHELALKAPDYPRTVRVHELSLKAPGLVKTVRVHELSVTAPVYDKAVFYQYTANGWQPRTLWRWDGAKWTQLA